MISVKKKRILQLFRRVRKHQNQSRDRNFHGTESACTWFDYIKNKHFSHNYILYGRSKTIFHFSICTTDGLILLNSLYSFYLIILPLSLTKSVKSFNTLSINYNCRLSMVPLFEIDQRKKYFLPLRNECFQYSNSQESGVRKTSYSRLKLRVIVLSLFKSSISLRTLSVFRLSQSSFLLSWKNAIFIKGTRVLYDSDESE